MALRYFRWSALGWMAHAPAMTSRLLGLWRRLASLVSLALLNGGVAAANRFEYRYIYKSGGVAEFASFGDVPE